MIDPHTIKACREMKEIHLGGAILGIDALELFLNVLNAEGECRIIGCGGASAMELGAGLQRIASSK